MSFLHVLQLKRPLAMPNCLKVRHSRAPPSPRRGAGCPESRDTLAEESSDSGSLSQGTNGISSAVPAGFTATAIKTVRATQFGKGDREDEGTGSPTMGTVQTNSDVVGASVKISVMAAVFGANWRHDPKRFDALIEIYFKKSRRMVRVPLVDIGPAESAPSRIRLFELIRRVDLHIQLDRLLRRSFEPQRLPLVRIIAPRRLRGQRAREGVRVVLKNDDARQRIKRVQADDRAFHHSG